MGMSATQANLLCLTSRLHDVENKAQFIESEKIALANQQDAIYQTYCAALDATKIQVAFNNASDGKRFFVDATFENVCTYDPTRCKQYSLTNAKTGKLFVTPDMKEAYDKFKDDKYNFAWYMLMTEEKCSQGSWNGNWDKEEISVSDEGVSLTQVEELVFRRHAEGFCCYEEDVKNDNGDIIHHKGEYADSNSNNALNTLYENYYNTYNDKNATTEDKLKALYELRDALYTTYGNEIYNLMKVDKQAATFPGFFVFDQNSEKDLETQLAENRSKSWDKGRQIYSYVDFTEWYEEEQKKGNYSSSYLDIDKEIGDDSFPRAEFNYYVNLWQSITNAGGCEEVPVAAEAGDESNKWFNDMVKSGRAIINVYNENTKEWGETNVATSVNVNFLQENQDETDLKKAEAEYEYQLSMIEKKDTEFDRELSKLETERSSIKQIMESIKKVKDENIDRTFNIFS